ncbi:VOC family protein [Shimazuella alba]|uniref:VOC family protein n=1 Tax=Shimazuella alba TaxID=2690964 RepID=A0A6I4VRE5_9BACL|nr:VOC family protein [Shimazuella alba]MXQ52998.1 VOC family protein [Shimazuella alba]
MSSKGIAHIAIQAVDYRKTIDFYTKVFDFKVGHFWSLPEFQIHEASMLVSPDGRTCIEVFDNEAVIAAQGKKAESPEQVAFGALLHFAFYVEDVDLTFQKALEYGATKCIEPATLQLGDPVITVRNALIYSPNGEVIELIEEVNFDLSSQG